MKKVTRLVPQRLQWALLSFGVLASLGSGVAVAGNPVAGEQVYNTFCISCHGMGGRNPVAGAPMFARGEGLMKPDMQLVQYLRMGSAAKPPFGGILSDRELHDVITYLRTLR